MPAHIEIGERLPEAVLGQLRDGRIESVTSWELFRGYRSIVLGVPGAFTPLCTQEHVPDFVTHADALKRSGYERLICVAANDPFAVAAWQAALDPEGKVEFVSDGNLDFNRRLGLLRPYREAFLGDRSERYLLVIDDMILRHIRIEPNALSYSVCRAQDALDVALLDVTAG